MVGVLAPSMVLLPLFLAIAHAATNNDDVYALNVLFSAMSSPPPAGNVMQGWSTLGGDPCSERWKGVTCVGPNVTQVSLPGLNLMGGLGYALDKLSSLLVLDLSNNNLVGIIPFQLPPNVHQLSLAYNRFSGGLPYSLTYLAKIAFLNVSGNALSGSIPDIFQQSKTLTGLDFSHNNLSGPFPSSLGILASLTTLHVQNNQLTGTIDVLATLPLKDLDVSNNNLSGTIPNAMETITFFRYTGNNFNLTGGPFSLKGSPQPAEPNVSNLNTTYDGGFTQAAVGTRRTLKRGHIAGIVVAAVLTTVLAVLIVLFFTWKSRNHDGDNTCETPSQGDMKVKRFRSIKLRPKPGPEEAALQPPYATIKCLNSKEKTLDGDVPCKIMKNSISASSYKFGELQAATNSFCQENLVGEGTSARVYKAKFSNGKVLAIKKLDSSIVMVHEKDFLEALAGISRLRHANITELAGYCVDHGHRILVYDYISNGTLHEALHFGEEKSSRLPWNHRIKIALGAARALE